MTAPTAAVTIDLAAMTGQALPGVLVRAKLDINEVYDGFIIATTAEGLTDSSGRLVLNLFPNASPPTGLGTQGSTYIVTAYIPNGQRLQVMARIPNAACRLEDCIVTEATQPLTPDQIAKIAAGDYMIPTWAYAEAWSIVSGTRNADGALTSASILWPDGATGTFSAIVLSTNFPGAIDAWTATYSSGTLNKTITQPTVTRDASGAVSVRPALTVTTTS